MLLQKYKYMELTTIQSRIYEIRDTKVMLDFDLAQMYGIETRVLKQAVRRNLKRFEGDDFMFELTKEELSTSQFVTLKKGRGSNFKYAPFAFTELGVAMLSSVLNSDIAIEINRAIMRAFVAIRQGLPQVSNNKELEELKARMKELEEVSEETMAAINDLSEDTRKELDEIYLALSQLASEPKQATIQRPAIGYKAIQEKRK